MHTEKPNPQLGVRRKGAERNQFVCANESKAGSHQGQIEHEISGSEVLEDGSEDVSDCTSGKAGSKLTLTKLLKFIYLLTRSSTGQMFIRSATFCKKDRIRSPALSSSSAPLCQTIPGETRELPSSTVLTEGGTDFGSIPTANDLKELCNLTFPSPKSAKSKNNVLRLPGPKKDFQR